jgi:hypothetical protein
MQKEAIISKINQMINKKVYPGLTFENGIGYDFDEVPGLKEAGWTQRTYQEAREGEEKTFEQQCSDILKSLNEHQNSWPF